MSKDQYLVRVDLETDPINNYNTLNDDQKHIFDQFVERYPFRLDNFQQQSIFALLNGDNVLAAVPTSCGKTIVAEFSIWYNCQIGKKTIYCSPIKSLSNDKYADFKKKFAHDQIGIITGDVKFNPDAPCIIMTTEILRDLLFKKSESINNVGSVVFDEVHYINNDERGHVWEQCLMLLPPSIQLVMLSATISKPELFANWIGNIKQKRVHLSVHQNRPVPLVHYMYNDYNGSIEPYFNNGNCLIDTYQSHYNRFQKTTYRKSEVAFTNGLVKFLKDNDLCPTLFFIFSRAKCEVMADKITESFHTTQEQTEVEKTINSLLSQYQYDYNTLKRLPQVIKMIDLAKKGIAFHHSGLLSFTKEIIEILFGKGMIKIMFVTETFSVGINMPTRTVVFNDLTKNVNGKVRNLYTDEYYQMAGRAGRRGLDTKGHVIYAPINRMLSLKEIRHMLEGEPMSIRSRYQVDYQLVLQQLNHEQPYEIVQQSYMFQELQRFVSQTEIDFAKVEHDLEILKNDLLKIDISEDARQLICQYIDIQEDEKIDIDTRFNIKQSKSGKSRRQQFKNQLKQKGIMNSSENFNIPYAQYHHSKIEIDRLQQEHSKLSGFLENPDRQLRDKYLQTISILQKNGLVDENKKLTIRGKLAATINNSDGILIVSMLDNIIKMDTINLGLLLSLLTTELSGRYEMTVNDVDCESALKMSVQRMDYVIQDLIEKYPGYYPKEMPADLLDATFYWLKGCSFIEIVEKLAELQGNFVRSMLKLLHLCDELILGLTTIGQHLELETKLRDLSTLINREVVIFDSIYIKS